MYPIDFYVYFVGYLHQV